MNILNKVLTSATLAILIATPMTHTYQENNWIKPPVVLSENPPNLLESAGYVALFLIAAYALKNMIPAVVVEKTPQEKACPIVEAVLIETPKAVEACVMEESVEVVELMVESN